MRGWAATLDGEWNDAGGEQRLSLDAGMEAEEDLYFQTFPVYTPQGAAPLRTGSAPADADGAADSLVPKDVQIKVRPLRNRAVYQKQAQDLVYAAQGLLYIWRRKKDVLRQIANDQALRRVGVARVLFDEDLWEARPDDWADLDDDARDAWEVRRRRQCPIRLERRNPRYVRWRELDDGTMLAVVERFQTTVLEARATYSNPLWADALAAALKGRDLNDTVTIEDVWYAKWRCVLVNETPIAPIGRAPYRGVFPHRYPEIPYVVAPFRELGFENPGARYRGLLSNTGGLYAVESEALSNFMTWLRWFAHGGYVGWVQDQRDLQILPGHLIPINRTRGEYIEPLRKDTVSPELTQMAGIVQTYLQRNGVAIGPLAGEATRSAQQVWALQAMRQLKLEFAKEALERLLERAFTLAMLLIEHRIGEPVTLPIPGPDRQGKPRGEVRIGPAQINGYVDGFEVNFGKRIDPATLEQSKTLFTYMSNQQMPRRVAWAMSGLTDNPQEWEDELIQQAGEMDPFILQLKLLEDLQAFYGEDTWQYQTAKRRVQESQAPPNPQGVSGQNGGAGGGTAVPGMSGDGTGPGQMQGPGAMPRVTPQQTGAAMRPPPAGRRRPPGSAVSGIPPPGAPAGGGPPGQTGPGGGS
jgi:hypothetical protein